MENNRAYKHLNGRDYDIGFKEHGITYPEFEKTLIYLEALGKSIYPNFRIDPKDRGLYELLFGYFFQNKQFCEDNKVDLNKGLLLFGSSGVGKTAILKLFAHFFSNSKSKIDFYSMQSLSALGSQFGSQFLCKINFNSDFILDDIGSESPSNFFKDHFEPFKRILNKYEEVNYAFARPDDLSLVKNIYSGWIQSTRQNRRVSRKIYATTNLDLKMMESRYGTRIISRTADFFNIIPLSSKVDKRTANANIISV